MLALRTIGLCFCVISGGAIAHGEGPWSPPVLDWSTDQIQEVAAFGTSPRPVVVNGKSCLVGSRFILKIRDDYAFDIDETVWLEAELPSSTPGLSITYDAHGGKEDVLFNPDSSSSDEWRRASIPLERARLANLNFLGSDLLMAAAGNEQDFTICNLSVRRSYSTQVAKTFGWITLGVTSERNEPTPARVGIYDLSGRLPLPGDDAAPIRQLHGHGRVIRLGKASTWPVENRTVFYTDGHYHAQLPVGAYEVIVAKGPEFRVARQKFNITANETQTIELSPQRWTDMAAKQWYSGEDHIHYPLAGADDDHTLGLFTRAEDVKVSNVLEMGNAFRTYFKQREWRPISTDDRGTYMLVPGLEDPRTTLRGHAIQMNIRRPVRNPEQYLLYHELFEKVREQGGLAGYAHVLDSSLPEQIYKRTMRGIVLDVPFGLVDFAEIMTGHAAGSASWFDFLNLGYKVSPSAGSDYPYVDIPGAVRNYVKIEGPFTSQGWFDGLKQGKVFVTSGPMLELSINGQQIGSELRVKKGELLRITGKATLNPDIDALSSVELIEQGDVTKTASPKGEHAAMEIHNDLRAEHGTWFVLRARGKNPHVIAMSAPVYVIVDGQSFWKPSAVPSIVARLKPMMQELLVKPSRRDSTEWWEASALLDKYWDVQQSSLAARIAQASALYDELAARAASSPQHRNKIVTEP